MSRYRAFLLWYFLALVPALVVVFLAFLVLGWGGKAGLLRSMSLQSMILAGMVYFCGAIWPLMAASARRLHDLGYRFRDHFFSLSPGRNWRLGQEMLSKRGEITSNAHGEDPGVFE